MPSSPSSPREITFHPAAPLATRTVGFLLRSVPVGIWILMYLLFSLPMLWDNWQKLATGPVPVWRWAAALVFPFLLFGLLCLLQKSSLRLTGPVSLKPDGLHLGKRGRVKEYWTSISCEIESVAAAPGVHRLVIRATTSLSQLTGPATVYSALTEDLEHARQFAVAFNKRYAPAEKPA